MFSFENWINLISQMKVFKKLITAKEPFNFRLLFPDLQASFLKVKKVLRIGRKLLSELQ